MTEVWIIDTARTPIGRYAGALARVRADDLAAAALRGLLARVPALPQDAIEEVALGCANQAGEDNRNVARMALLLAGLPPATPGVTVNRLCASGMDAVTLIARAIRSGEIDIGIAGGVESMTRAPFVMGKADQAFSRSAAVEDTTIGWRFINPLMKAQYGVDSMPETAENVAQEFQVDRTAQDRFALASQQRAARAASVLAEEIVPVTLPKSKTGPAAFEADEHPRPDTTAEALAKLRPIVREGGTVTAGNASGVNDGAAALLLASPAAAERHGLRPIARIAGVASAGVPPRIMGIGPVPAVRKLLERHGLDIGAIEAMELNEAFASQGIACLRQWGVAEDADWVNPNGGAIALGHPLGMSGARIVATLARQMRRTGAKRGVATMCVGVGQGVATLLEGVNA
jgi:3-oxoadipyl-CoA thiolase